MEIIGVADLRPDNRAEFPPVTMDTTAIYRLNNVIIKSPPAGIPTLQTATDAAEPFVRC